MGRKWRMLLVLVCVEVLVYGLQVIGPAVTAAVTFDCDRPLVVGARGAVQNDRFNSDNLGPQVARAMGGFAVAYGQGPIDPVALDYPATNVKYLLIRPKTFFDSVDLA
jgi:hypothetical protein